MMKDLFFFCAGLIVFVPFVLVIFSGIYGIVNSFTKPAKINNF